MSKPPFNPSSGETTAPLDLLHIDVCGPLRVSESCVAAGGSGMQYFLTVLDDYSGCSMVRLLKHKGDAAGMLRDIVKRWENMLGRSVKTVHSDRGLEFCNKELSEWCARKGIVHQLTCPHTPEQNGKAERLNRTLLDKVRAMLREAQLGNEWWGEAVLTANYLRNRSPAAGKALTPINLFTNNEPDISHLRVWGCDAYVLIPRGQRDSKLNPVSYKGKFVGYAHSGWDPTAGYWVWVPELNKVVVSRSVKFDENVYWVDEQGRPVSKPGEKRVRWEQDIEPTHNGGSQQRMQEQAQQQVQQEVQSGGSESGGTVSSGALQESQRESRESQNAPGNSTASTEPSKSSASATTGDT